MKTVKEMTSSEFRKAIAVAQTEPFSPFAQFCTELRGYTFIRSGRHLDKWELWEMGMRDPSRVLSDGYVGVKAVRKGA